MWRWKKQERRELNNIPFIIETEINSYTKHGRLIMTTLCFQSQLEYDLFVVIQLMILMKDIVSSELYVYCLSRGKS